MDVEYALLDCSYKHILYTRPPYEVISNKSIALSALKGERFAFQLMLGFSHECMVSIGSRTYIGWKGLGKRARVEISGPQDAKLNAFFVGYVKDDCGTLTADPILTAPCQEFEEGIQRMIWIEGQIPEGFEGDCLSLGISIYVQDGYEDEVHAVSKDVTIDVLDIKAASLRESEFYLDLWQHPSSWARYYEAKLWSQQHWDIIENNIRELSSMGQKVVTIIGSDYSWAGQSCYKFPKNASNLFEYNMVGVSRNSKGGIECDFSVIDRYLELCSKYGMDQEIDIFGLMGNWDAFSFGSPIADYSDPMRISVYDEGKSGYSFIRNAQEFAEYVKLLFGHLMEKGVWNKVFIMSDEPNNPAMFEESLRMFESCANGERVRLKSALHDEGFFEKSLSLMDSVSLNLELTAKRLEDVDAIKQGIAEKGGKLSWFVCCVPERPNNFIGSALVESRIMGWLTYFFEMDGFLRWDYAIWPRDPWNEPSYKFPRWRAGDMFFVYPGKDKNPVRSIRWENLRFGIQDFELFRLAEKRGMPRAEIHRIMEGPLGAKSNIRVAETGGTGYVVDIGYSMDSSSYTRAKAELVKRLIKG